MNLSLRSDNQRLPSPKSAEGPLFSFKLVAGLLAAVTATAIFYAHTRISALEVSYRLAAAAQTRRELMEQARHLKVELSHLRSPERLERAAERLGLAAPKPAQIRVLP
jgi:cell division protein FtsL